jgi:hypothetical protein
VAHGKDPNSAATPIDGIDDPEASHTVLPESLQFPHERFTQGRITPESMKGRLDAAFQVRRKMSDDLSDMGRNVDVVGSH